MFTEIVRCLDSLQLCDREKGECSFRLSHHLTPAANRTDSSTLLDRRGVVATPVGWNVGDRVIVHNSLKTEDAKKHFKNEVEEVSHVLFSASPGNL